MKENPKRDRGGAVREELDAIADSKHVGKQRGRHLDVRLFESKEKEQVDSEMLVRQMRRHHDVR